MKKIILVISFLLLFVIQSISAQSKISFSLGGGYISSAIDKTKLPYWENGYLISVSSDYKILDKIALFVSSSYQKHFFNENLLTITVPQVVGYRYSVNGENSSVIELSAGGKFYISTSRIKPYLGIGVGALFIEQGKVEITNWMEGSSNKSTGLYANTGKNYTLAQFNFGLGIEIQLIDNFQLVLDGKLISGFGGPSYFPLTASIKYSL